MTAKSAEGDATARALDVERGRRLDLERQLGDVRSEVSHKAAALAELQVGFLVSLNFENGLTPMLLRAISTAKVCGGLRPKIGSKRWNETLRLPLRLWLRLHGRHLYFC